MLFTTVLKQPNLATVTPNDCARFCSDKRESARHVVLFCRFKKETVVARATVKFFECRNRRLSICHELGENRNDIAASSKAKKFVERWIERRGGHLAFEFEKVGQDFFAIRRKDRLRMKLHAIHREFAMTERHDLVPIGLRDHFEARGK
jgi:hypothetical protein